MIPTPSREDVELTERVRKAAQLFDITMIDHLVIATLRGMPVRTYVSLRKVSGTCEGET